VRCIRSGGENSAATEPVTFVLPASATSCALGASSASDCMLLSAISTPVRQSLLLEPHIQVLDPVLASPLYKLGRKKKNYELNQHSQDSWAS
jgi:hypothetical protein